MHKLPLIEKASFDHGFRNNKKWDEKFVFSVFIFVVFAGLGVILFRLFQLTVVKGEYYRRLSDENRIREIVIEPKRGTILDRHGAVIAESQPTDYHTRQKTYPAKRIYPEAEALAHLLGYRQLGDLKDIEASRCQVKLKSGEKTGKKGVEKVYDCDLKGTIGKKLIELDARGKEKKLLRCFLLSKEGHCSLRWTSGCKKKHTNL